MNIKHSSWNHWCQYLFFSVRLV